MVDTFSGVISESGECPIIANDDNCPPPKPGEFHRDSLTERVLPGELFADLMIKFGKLILVNNEGFTEIYLLFLILVNLIDQSLTLFSK